MLGSSSVSSVEPKLTGYQLESLTLLGQIYTGSNIVHSSADDFVAEFVLFCLLPPQVREFCLATDGLHTLGGQYTDSDYWRYSVI